MATKHENLIKAHQETLATGLQWAQLEVLRINKANGWFDSDRTFGDDIALMHSEVSEALEAFRNYKLLDVTTKLCAGFPHQEDGSNYPATEEHLCKPEGVGSEFADVLVRLLDTCERYDIDLGEEFLRKIKYNETRGYRHGNKGL